MKNHVQSSRNCQTRWIWVPTAVTFWSKMASDPKHFTDTWLCTVPLLFVLAFHTWDPKSESSTVGSESPTLPRFPGVFSVQQLWRCCQVSRQEREASLNVFIKIIYIHSHVVLANTSTTRKMTCVLLSPPWGLCLMLTPTHRGSETLHVLCSYLSYSSHHCLAMARVGSPSRATINQENFGHRNKKYL